MRNQYTDAPRHILISCLQCGTERRVQYHVRDRGYGKFCSHPCYAESLRSRRRPVADRFWPRVHKSDGCWLWMGKRTSRGYGRVWDGARVIGAHRAAWELTNGPIRIGGVVMHLCDTPACVRPDHLRVGTQAENMADMKAKGRSASGERSGVRTHPEQVHRGDASWSRLHLERVARGERAGAAKLTNAQVAELRARHAASSIRTATLAVEYGISPRSVRDILAGKTYAHAATP